MLPKYILNKLLFENNPELIRDQCVNSRQNKRSCTVCQDACPTGAIVDGTPDSSICIGCNTCVTVCPSQCLRPSKKFMGRMLEILEQVKDHCVVGCESRDDPADLKLVCLGSLPWEIMAILSLQGDLSVLHGHCANCPQQEQLWIWEQSLGKLRAFWGDALFEKKVHIYTNASPSHQSLSRREAFSFLFSKLKKTTMSTLILDNKSLDPDGSVYRQLLVYRLLQLQRDSDPDLSPACSWLFPTFTTACTACGICVKICPRQALHRVEAAKQLSETRSWYMAVIPWRCTNCGLCQMVCPREGLGDFTYKQTPDPTKPHAITITAPCCQRCGEPMPGEAGTICSFCQAENRDQTGLYF
ncbi:MAG: 4Fe-4S binding protein [Peptococcaceae bacterium]|nr:4Fe-4S binding protein [Peptococcaceae bacterium]